MRSSRSAYFDDNGKPSKFLKNSLAPHTYTIVKRSELTDNRVGMNDIRVELNDNCVGLNDIRVELNDNCDGLNDNRIELNDIRVELNDT
ncbi:hypothetical protein [Camelliibacillus cellulosilyticus]|uniref:hypothetical protein n=1 Tax=Camelliibacillus cellulosilyticus TaxID=2174486 RepID=UPI00366FB741